MANNLVLGREELSDLFENQGVTGFDLERAMDTVEEINHLKQEKGAIILAHYYQEPPIQLIADVKGDSLKLAYAAREIKDKNQTRNPTRNSFTLERQRHA